MIDGGSMHRTPVAKQKLVGNPEAAVLVVEKIAQAGELAAVIPRRSKTPVGDIARIEIDLEDTMAVGYQVISELGRKGRTDALQKQKRTSQATEIPSFSQDGTKPATLASRITGVLATGLATAPNSCHAPL
jgi:hypothetical protein